MRSSLWEDLLASIPDEWEVSGDTRQAIDQFLLGRARFLSDNFRDLFIREMPQGILDFDSLGEGTHEH